MSVLSKFREWFAPTEADHPQSAPPLSLDEKLALAAADRGYAFSLLEDAEEALADSSVLEAEVAAESLRRSELALTHARENAARILQHGHERAVEHEERAACAQANANDDETALAAIRKLRNDELHDTGPCATGEGWDS